MSQSLPTQKCERTVIPKEKFHKNSFRWTHQGDVHLLVGCPLVSERGGKKSPTKWVEGAKPGSQCQIASTGAKAGTRVHNIVLPSKGGACKTHYRKA